MKRIGKGISKTKNYEIKPSFVKFLHSGEGRWESKQTKKLYFLIGYRLIVRGSKTQLTGLFYFYLLWTMIISSLSKVVSVNLMIFLAQPVCLPYRSIDDTKNLKILVVYKVKKCTYYSHLKCINLPYFEYSHSHYANCKHFNKSVFIRSSNCIQCDDVNDRIAPSY